MSTIFRFKQFEVDQAGCGMKINTDGVLLGALAAAAEPAHLLDIGTGTGVIALMLAQRYPEATVDAVEIDEPAAATAQRNFSSAAFSSRLRVYHSAFQDFTPQGYQYDLIVSNPPFFLASLKNPNPQKLLARHTDQAFFKQLIDFGVKNLAPDGLLYLVLPPDTAAIVIELARFAGLFLKKRTTIRSFIEADTHRVIIALGFNETGLQEENLVIYSAQKVYSDQYRESLSSFLTIF